MTRFIQLRPEDESRLVAVAHRQGMAPAHLAANVLHEHLPRSTDIDQEQDPTLALFAQWDLEDAQMTPEELEQERQQFEEFGRNVNVERRRAGARIIYR